MADAADLNSAARKGVQGSKSRLRHHEIPFRQEDHLVPLELGGAA